MNADELGPIFNGVRARNGEWHIDCPACGHASTPRDPHCSFNNKGWHCFSCGSGGSLKNLAHLMGGPDYDSIIPELKPRIREEAPHKPLWMTGWDMWQYDSVIRNGEEHWKKYKPLPSSAIWRNRLCLGAMPASSCSHARLLVPIIKNGNLVGIRGRQIDCQCPGKWLVPAGTRLEWLPLYVDKDDEGGFNGRPVVLVENPIDALLVGTEIHGYRGAAIYSSGYWNDDWIDILKTASKVIVALDNDLVGNGGGQNRNKFIIEWLKTHPSVPRPNGPKIANHLLKNGINASLYEWGKDWPFKSDIGDVIERRIINGR